METGQVGILNVGAGNIRLSFDPNNPAERIRSARIVTDMLRRGYALLVETTDANGEKVFTRAREFREDTCEYIIADFDPIVAAEVDGEDDAKVKQEAAAPGGSEVSEAKPKPRKGGRVKAVDAGDTRAVAVARSAGG